METYKLIAELEKTASELEAQAEAVKTASVNKEASAANYTSFLSSMVKELGLEE